MKKEIKRTEIATKRLTLDLSGDLPILNGVRVTMTYNAVYEVQGKEPHLVSKDKIAEHPMPMAIELREVSAETLSEQRSKGIPSFVLKVGKKLYMSCIPDDISFTAVNLIGAHLCAASGKECERMSAAPDEKGGCAKVRARSNSIERFDWIVKGYETFNTKHDCFVVIECDHYAPVKPRKPVSAAERNALKLSLAQHIWDDVDTLAEARARRTKNKAADSTSK